jgi:hypothetical protein
MGLLKMASVKYPMLFLRGVKISGANCVSADIKVRAEKKKTNVNL